MAAALEAAFVKKPCFVGYITGGFPTSASTVPALLAMGEAGVGVIEVRTAVSADSLVSCEGKDVDGM